MSILIVQKEIFKSMYNCDFSQSKSMFLIVYHFCMVKIFKILF